MCSSASKLARLTTLGVSLSPLAYGRLSPGPGPEPPAPDALLSGIVAFVQNAEFYLFIERSGSRSTNSHSGTRERIILLPLPSKSKSYLQFF